jgi:hypothetical protein
MENQSDFLFADGPVPDLLLPDPRSAFYGEVAAVWNLPLGQKIRVLLKGHDFPGVAGCLELSHAPDLPLNVREPLQLSVGGITFLSTQMASWSLLG